MIVFPVWPVSITQEEQPESNISNVDGIVGLSEDGNYVILAKEEVISSLDKLIKSMNASIEKNSPAYKYKAIKSFNKENDKFASKQLSLFQTYDLDDKYEAF